MDTYDPKGLRFLVLALLFVLFGTGAVQAGFKVFTDPNHVPHGATQWALLCTIQLCTLGIGAVSLIVAKKFVDRYADRRPR